MNLNIPQLTLAKLTEPGRHKSVHTGGPSVLGSQVESLQDVPFILKLICSSLHKQYKNDNIANFVYLQENANTIVN